MKKSEAARHIWPYVKPHFGVVIISMLFSIPMAAIQFSGAPAVKFLTDEVLAKKATLAEDMLALYNGRWNGSVEPVFTDYQY